MTYHDKIFLLLSSRFVLSLPFSSEPQWAGALLKLPGRMVLHYQTQGFIVSPLFSSITRPLSGVLNKNDSNARAHNDPLLTGIQRGAHSGTHQTCTETFTHTNIHRPSWAQGPDTQAKVFRNTFIQDGEKERERGLNKRRREWLREQKSE